MNQLEIEELLNRDTAGEREFTSVWLVGFIEGADFSGINLKDAYLEGGLGLSYPVC